METNDYYSKPLPPRLIPVTKWNQFHEWPPIGGLRHLIFHRKTNGFDKVIRRANRRILIDEKAFEDWIERQTEKMADLENSPKFRTRNRTQNVIGKEPKKDFSKKSPF